MSALGHKRILISPRHVRFTPNSGRSVVDPSQDLAG